MQGAEAVRRRAREGLARTLLRAHLLPIALLLGAMGVGGEVTAQGPPGSLQVTPGATCLTEQGVSAVVSPWLPEQGFGGDTRIEVNGDPISPQRVDLRVVRGGKVVAHRLFDPAPARCDTLHAAIGLAAALALKASLLAELGTPQPDDPAAQTEPQPEPELQPSPESLPTSWALSAQLAAAYNVLPRLAPGLELGGLVLPSEDFQLALGAFAYGRTGVPLREANAAFDAGLFGARVDGCVRLLRGADVTLRACLGLQAGALLARGTQLPAARQTTVPWIAAANTLGLDVPLDGPWALLLDLSLRLPLRKVRLWVEDEAGQELDRWEAPLFGLTLGAGLRHEL